MTKKVKTVIVLGTLTGLLAALVGGVALAQNQAELSGAPDSFAPAPASAAGSQPPAGPLYAATPHPTGHPTDHPTDHPTAHPTDHPTDHPTVCPTDHPHPTDEPHPTACPTDPPNHDGGGDGGSHDWGHDGGGSGGSHDGGHHGGHD